MKTFKRAMAWLKKYSNLDLTTLPKSLRKKILLFKIMRFIVLIAAGAWTFVPNMVTLIAGAIGAVCLFILSGIIEPRLDKALKLHSEEEKIEMTAENIKPILKTLRLCTSDIKKSKNFYSGLFKKSPDDVDIGFVSFNILGTKLEIVKAGEKDALSTGESIGYFEVDDIQEYIDRAIGLGGKIAKGPLAIQEKEKMIVEINDGCDNVVGFEMKKIEEKKK